MFQFTWLFQLFLVKLVDIIRRKSDNKYIFSQMKIKVNMSLQTLKWVMKM